MLPLPRLHTTRRLWPLLLCLALAACADAPSRRAAGDSLFSDESFAPPSERISPDDVFRLNPAMRSYLETRVTEESAKHGEARGLVEALFQDRRLQIDYDAEFTRNAAQTFDAHAGNCLSLAIVTGAMAKELGLEVLYQSVKTSEQWERDGDLLERVGHVNVTVGFPAPKMHAWGLDRDRWTVDFLPFVDRRGLVAQPISESRIVAMYMNNRAAEALARQRTDDAYWWLRSGIAADPAFSSLYNTLGVTYLRKGLLARSEAALRFALAMDQDSPETWSNLAVVLRRDGRMDEAATIESQHAPSRAAALLTTINDGMKANAAGDYARALKLFQRALRTASDNHEVHYQLAVTYLNLGDRGRAMEQLRVAADDSLTNRQRKIYTSKLEMLKSTTSSFRLDPTVLQAN